MLASEQVPPTEWEKAARQLLRGLRRHLGLHWHDLATELGEDVHELQNMGWGRRKIPPALLKKIFDLRDRKSVPIEIPSVLRYQNTGSAQFISTLGLDLTDIERSIKLYAGRYLHMLLDADDHVTISYCRLRYQIGPDDTPTFTLWRKADDGRRVVVGAYFSNGDELFLIGSRQYYTDLRMSVFKINPGEDGRKLKGIATGVSYSNAIFATRCYLLPISRAIRSKVGVYSTKEIEEWCPEATTYFSSDDGHNGSLRLEVKE